ncbi:MAG: hypothetical protein IPJ26_13830 [Bacteroidetes bacterium]|nr:hypothetical protein [Bacteroidota bacterium]
MKILTIGQDNFSIPNMDGYEIDCYIPTDNISAVIKYVQQSNADIIFYSGRATCSRIRPLWWFGITDLA